MRQPKATRKYVEFSDQMTFLAPTVLRLEAASFVARSDYPMRREVCSGKCLGLPPTTLRIWGVPGRHMFREPYPCIHVVHSPFEKISGQADGGVKMQGTTIDGGRLPQPRLY